MKTLKLFLITVLFAFLANSCSNLLTPPHAAKSGKLPAGKGSFSLKIAGAERTIMPAEALQFNENLYYELIFTPIPDGKETTVDRTYQNRAEAVILDVGEYSLVVNVYEDQGKTKPLLSGTVDTIKIQAGKPATADVKLEPAGGEGTFSWDITLPETAASASMEIKKRGGETPEKNIPLNEEKKGTCELPSGVYDVKIIMTGKSDKVPDVVLTVTRKEILHIYNHRESPYKKSFADINFEIVYEVKFLDAAGERRPVYVVHGAAIPEDYFDDDFLVKNGYKPPLDGDAFLYEGDAPDKPGFVLEGWFYEDVDHPSGAIWEKESPVTKDLTFDPQWSGPVDVSGTNTSAFANIVDYINGITTTGPYTLFIAGNVTLEESLTIKNGVNLTVKGADTTIPHSIKRGFSDTGNTTSAGYNSGLFIVETGAYLTFENIIIHGQKTVFSENKMPLVRINSGGTFTMNDGAVLQDNIAGTTGGGVYVGSNSTFTMAGGTISGNEVGQSGNGGAVFINGTFTMSGNAKITGNTAGGSGGGVYLVSGTFTMNGGTIGGEGTGSGNTAKSGEGGGGGVYVQSGTFTMTDGKISGNTATTGNNSCGGGVLIEDGNFEMSGGNINDNTAHSLGGGVCILGGKFTMTGGEISGNEVDVDGGGIIIENDSGLEFGGTAVVKENYNKKSGGRNKDNAVLGTNGCTLSSGGNAPRTDMEIWVTAGGVIVDTGATSGDARYFRSDDEGKVVVFENNQLVLKGPSLGDLDFTLLSGNTAYSVKARDPYNVSSMIIIPAKYNNLPVTKIDNDAFAANEEITSVYIPATVTSIGSSAFEDCYRLVTVTFAPDRQLETIGDNAFHVTGLTSVTIPATVTSIGIGAFSEILSLTTVTFAAGSQLTTIGNDAFAYASFTGISIPAGVTSIGDYAFYETGLTSITISAGVTSIGIGAFAGCQSLPAITVNAQNPNYTSQNGILYNKAKTTLLQVPGAIVGSVTIPEGVTSISSEAFASCKKITNVTIPPSVMSIGDGTFFQCDSLINVIIPAGLTSISSNMFAYCDNLTSVSIPASVTSIDEGAFFDCKKITSVSIPANVTSIGMSAFGNCIGITSITIPASVTSVGTTAFASWTTTQTINVEGYANQTAANSAWGNSWRSGCNAIINYNG